MPPAPPGYEAPISWDDTIDALIVIDRSGFGELDDEPTHAIDRFALQLAGTFSFAIPYECSDPDRHQPMRSTRRTSRPEIHAVVTNDQRWAEWGRSWGGNVVEVDLVGGDELITLRSRGGSSTFGADQYADAAMYASDEVEFQADDPPGPDGPRAQDDSLFLSDLVADLVALDRLDDDRVAVLSAMVEPLTGQVRRLLLDGVWSVARGYAIGTEEEIGRDLEEARATAETHQRATRQSSDDSDVRRAAERGGHGGG